MNRRARILNGAARATRLLRRLVGGEAVVVAGAMFTAAVLSSLAPPPPAFALAGSALAHVDPGRVAASVSRAKYRLQVLVAPNKAAAPDDFALRITRSGAPVRGATVTLAFNHGGRTAGARESRTWRRVARRGSAGSRLIAAGLAMVAGSPRS